MWQIIDVVPFGVAARHGVPARAPTSDGRNLCNWFITEINMRPINLFFKEDEVGKTPSYILVSPGPAVILSTKVSLYFYGFGWNTTNQYIFIFLIFLRFERIFIESLTIYINCLPISLVDRPASWASFPYLSYAFLPPPQPFPTQ